MEIRKFKLDAPSAFFSVDLTHAGRFIVVVSLFLLQRCSTCHRGDGIPPHFMGGVRERGQPPGCVCVLKRRPSLIDRCFLTHFCFTATGLVYSPCQQTDSL